MDLGARRQGFGRRDTARTAPRTAPVREVPAPRGPEPAEGSSPPPTSNPLTPTADRVISVLFERIDVGEAAKLDSQTLRGELRPMIADVTVDLGLTVSQSELSALEETVLNELIGLGPIEPLLADPEVSDILVNAPDKIFYERGGKLERFEGSFRDDAHVQKVAQRIANGVGRRVDLSSPLADARLADGSRVNIVVHPVALKGCTMSIRKFAVKAPHIDHMVGTAMSERMATALKVAARARFNILISGGTGSGKTTMLNALSALIDPRERIITIEDAAELRLQQPHVVSLETRPPSVDGTGAVTIPHLLKNALRMRPDRIILGEVRGAEAFDLLQAMNTGHDGSLATLHASSPREAITRVQHMVVAAQPTLPAIAITRQIVESVDLIVQIRRFHCGTRRVMSISEVAGMEDRTPLLRELYRFEPDERMDGKGDVVGAFVHGGGATDLAPKARLAGLEAEWLAAVK